jgi:hypothetical protein
LPWQIERLPGGELRVFGITLPRTTVAQASERWGARPSFGLFARDGMPASLEAYFGRVRLGGLESRLLAVVDTDPSLRAAFLERAVASRPQASGAVRHELSERDLDTARGLAIRELSYGPAARYGPDRVLRHFGEPSERLSVPDDRRYWMYPELGLIVLVPEDGREVFHYVPPKDFATARTRITEAS